MSSASVRKVEVQVAKVDAKLGLVFGYAIVCKVRNADGAFEDYYDEGSLDPDDDIVYSDHITERAMLEGVTAFMQSADRVATVDHERDDEGLPVQKGSVVHSFPLTEDIAERLALAQHELVRDEVHAVARRRDDADVGDPVHRLLIKHQRAQKRHLRVHRLRRHAPLLDIGDNRGRN